MKIAVGADHRGFNHKEYIKKNIKKIDWVDVGTFNEERSDYPLFAHAVCKMILQGEDVDLGVLICGSGIGMAIAANRYKNIYAALVWNKKIAQQAREQDNANIIVLPSDYISMQEAVVMVNTWRQASFFGGRYAARIKMIDEIE
ncbi:MAG: RpiB/LacA/LacB family sugar-phosphate isomerase [Candidatus Babeliales bacterium]